ncbi:DUF294 nucleotidyltransferase-like domain-containing protein [Zoogloea sp.]|uniref:DUF294 nucleotidyltransferase-like domain-containing protein n=1 Tax=Zoogloea sp. TaxID=49181 RepID=UPI00262AF603|nr:DUF294 nucleotidyltransferase-like domain-containing protein [uncultured Zoogloea sp.]
MRAHTGGGLEGLIRREPLSVLPELAVREVLRRMCDGDAAEAVVVAPSTGQPLGILTERDVIERIAQPAESLDVPVAGLMTGGVVALPRTAGVHEARLLLARHRLRRLVVVDELGRLAGVVSRDDLYAVRRPAADDLIGRIQAARDEAGLIDAARQVGERAAALVDGGEQAGRMGEWIALLNDLLVQAAIDLAEAEFDLPLVPWCWLAFGSEGRLEQTLHTDQDNGLIFMAAGEAEADSLRARFLPFARRVNGLLDACGFPLCQGGIMAGNPRWCLSLDEWRYCFADWMRSANADDLLNATIFFDFRALAGDAALADALRGWLLGAAADNALFLRFMTENALRSGPPLGRIRDFVVDRQSGRLDLKRDGTRPFVDAARIYALELGLAATATVDRLRAAGDLLRWSGREIDALSDAFEFILQLRLRQQRVPGAPANQVAPDELNDLERAFLKESLRQARRLQDRLRSRYQL